MFPTVDYKFLAAIFARSPKAWSVPGRSMVTVLRGSYLKIPSDMLGTVATYLYISSTEYRVQSTDQVISKYKK